MSVFGCDGWLLPPRPTLKESELSLENTCCRETFCIDRLCEVKYGGRTIYITPTIHYVNITPDVVTQFNLDMLPELDRYIAM